MRLLLDTHTLLWLVSGDAKLSQVATDVLIDTNNDLLISPATYWELAIKVGLGKLTLSTTYKDYVSRAVAGYGITIIDITFDDCVRYEALSFPHVKHRDPYDRMIVVHALRHSLSLVSIEDKLDGYGVIRHW